MHQHSELRRARIAVTLGDPAGVGPELIAKLLSDPANRQRADIVLLADQLELKSAIADAGGVEVAVSDGPSGPHGIQVLDDNTASQFSSIRAEVSEAGGARCMHQLKRALKMVKDGEIDAIVFGPLNKSSLKKAGMTEEDELRWFANQLDFKGTTSEINIAGSLWTGRVTSHIGVEDIAGRITKDSTLRAIELLHRLRWESGIESPRLGVCALNPHNGENGAFGRQEIDHICPAVAAAREKGIDVQGPFPCDTIFLKREHFDGIVTMYHDQGQIAMKLLSFDGGVTVQGGLPIPVATPAHGTAFDLAGKNLASVASTQNAFNVAVTMAERRISREGCEAQVADSVPVKKDLLPKSTVVEIASCC
ncbi:pyridoxal phosphate PdxA-domain-containing protein [Lipomyces tetrasporus]|uniref:Pyridoxal phosphate PdxA-domain-containing protein n=1 Tax=Lipomyces tetrasporus TaxID=54092 RepID=A0AAD7QXX9_9ASCO|nr:pyridoxal phosphate PdxA-domain-containing protein [Lipomyces tetrasporus]KAJ8103366.1 pyridoxal phosphate PdxA-domain-containing protein [Lipomyces tetrasporus]